MIKPMKKTLLVCLLLFVVFAVQAQSKRDSLSASLQGNNEVKLNILYALLGSPELSYERIISNNSAVGLSAFARVFQAVNMDFSYGIIPYFRRYFGVKKASGFFVEVHAAVHG